MYISLKHHNLQRDRTHKVAEQQSYGEEVSIMDSRNELRQDWPKVTAHPILPLLEETQQGPLKNFVVGSEINIPGELSRKIEQRVSII